VARTPEPGPVPKDSIRLYSMRFCPYAQRTRLVLHAKGIKFDTINIHLRNKPEWFLEKNPLGMVPTLETPAGEVIYESPITCEYLDEAPAKNDAGAFFQGIFLDNTPELKKWRAHMLEDPAVKATIHSVESHKAFFKGYAVEKPDYDYGL
uniref:GST N-terminal domain-containing protein n=1 Tax=Poecilia latipinna TaxID=48699 RepID=A0A3B3VJ96_9TELE